MARNGHGGPAGPPQAARPAWPANTFAPAGCATKSACADLLLGEHWWRRASGGVGDDTQAAATGNPRRRIWWRSPQARMYSLATLAALLAVAPLVALAAVLLASMEYIAMNDAELAAWFAANRTLFETAYLAGGQPWQQSGFGLHSQRDQAQWAALRRPIADAVTRSGAFLDIGCANGYLLECAMGWVAERGLTIAPYGLDFADELIVLARQRLPNYADHLYLGNAWDWSPPHRFDYARVSQEYVPGELRAPFVARLLRGFLTPNGRLLVAEYRARENTTPALTIDADVRTLGFAVEATTHGYLDGAEFTRVAVVRV